MDRRLFVASLASLPMIAASIGVRADTRTLQAASNYFNNISAAEGTFTQFNPNGSRARGRYLLMRPGRFRFEYSDSKALVLSDGSRIGVFDEKSNTGPQIYPLRSTPLRLLVQPKVDLTLPGVARDVSNDGTFTTVTLQDPKRPRDGSMTLVFRNSPPTLVEWRVREKSGQTTKVVVESITNRDRFKKSLFDIRRAEAERG